MFRKPKLTLDVVGNPLELPVVYTTPAKIKDLHLSGKLKPGQLVSIVNGERGPLNWLIRRSQVRMLLDHPILSKLAKVTLSWASRFSHSTVHFVDDYFIEMFAPKARFNNYNKYKPNQLLLVSTPLQDNGKKPSKRKLLHLSEFALLDVLQQKRYSVSELVYFYLWSWNIKKLWLGNKFINVFKSDSRDVCSGRYAYWATKATIWDKERVFPNAAYPALLVLDTNIAKPEYLIQLMSENDQSLLNPNLSLNQAKPIHG